MSIDACIAHAIHNDLDIVEAYPVIMQCDIKQVESYAERYVRDLQAKLSLALLEGKHFLDARDAVGLTVHLMNQGVDVPLEMLAAMCETIVAMYPMDVTYKGEMRTGESVYEVRMTIDLSEIFQA